MREHGNAISTSRAANWREWYFFHDGSSSKGGSWQQQQPQQRWQLQWWWWQQLFEQPHCYSWLEHKTGTQESNQPLGFLLLVAFKVHFLFLFFFLSKFLNLKSAAVGRVLWNLSQLAVLRYMYNFENPNVFGKGEKECVFVCVCGGNYYYEFFRLHWLGSWQWRTTAWVVGW
jgi:hypothetical protein